MCGIFDRNIKYSFLIKGRGVEAALGRWRSCNTGFSDPAGALEHIVSVCVAPFRWKTGPSTFCLTQARDAHCPCANFVSTWLGYGVLRYLAKHYFWMCLRGCFWMTLVFELVASVKQIAFAMWVVIIPSAERLNRRKVQGKGEFTFSAWLLSCDVGLVHLDWDLHHQLLWFPGLVIWTGIDTTVFPGPLPCRWQIMGFLSLQNHVSQHLVISQSLSLCIISVSIYLYLSVGSLENSD